MFTWLKRWRQRIRSVVRPEGYAIAGEQWCGYIPPEPMTHRQAEAVRDARELMERDARWKELVLSARNRR